MESKVRMLPPVSEWENEEEGVVEARSQIQGKEGVVESKIQDNFKNIDQKSRWVSHLSHLYQKSPMWNPPKIYKFLILVFYPMRNQLLTKTTSSLSLMNLWKMLPLKQWNFHQHLTLTTGSWPIDLQKSVTYSTNHMVKDMIANFW